MNQPEQLPKDGVEIVDSQDPVQPLSQTKSKKHWIIFGVVLLILIAAGITSWALIGRNTTNNNLNSSEENKSISTNTSQSTNTQVDSIPNAINPVNPEAIPLGTGKVSTTPQLGYVDFCNYKGASVAAEPSEPWINATNNTWDFNTKPTVEGSVSWAGSAYYTATLSGSTRTISTNDLPINHDTGIFPISKSDPAYHYDGNPNHIVAQPTTWKLQANPTAAASPSCTSDGPVGVLSDGAFLFNALDADNRDAGATEILDQWQGHPDVGSTYHHHTVPSYLLSEYSAKSSSTLVGYAIDGYGIYIERDASGNLLTDANLDVCHGRTSEVMWDGKLTNMYHYDATMEYPYTVGCFHGTPIQINMNNGGNSGTNKPPKP
ncbi:MAG: YHYH protein [Candidatus Saccharimonadales bacterium]